MTEKLSPTKQWEQDHPDDVRCPATPSAAKAWRSKRGITAKDQTQAKIAFLRSRIGSESDPWIQQAIAELENDPGK
jgi:hypothetical protein